MPSLPKVLPLAYLAYLTYLTYLGLSRDADPPLLSTQPIWQPIILFALVEIFDIDWEFISLSV